MVLSYENLNASLCVLLVRFLKIKNWFLKNLYRLPWAWVTILAEWNENKPGYWFDCIRILFELNQNWTYFFQILFKRSAVLENILRRKNLNFYKMGWVTTIDIKIKMCLCGLRSCSGWWWIAFTRKTKRNWYPPKIDSYEI